MKAKSRMPQRSGSPISIALETFGDRWSLLIVRDLMFKVLADIKSGKSKLARPLGETSNSFFRTLGEWNSYLQQIMLPAQGLSP